MSQAFTTPTMSAIRPLHRPTLTFMTFMSLARDAAAEVRVAPMVRK